MEAPPWMFLVQRILLVPAYCCWSLTAHSMFWYLPLLVACYFFGYMGLFFIPAKDILLFFYYFNSANVSELLLENVTINQMILIAVVLGVAAIQFYGIRNTIVALMYLVVGTVAFFILYFYLHTVAQELKKGTFAEIFENPPIFTFLLLAGIVVYTLGAETIPYIIVFLAIPYQCIDIYKTINENIVHAVIQAVGVELCVYTIYQHVKSKLDSGNVPVMQSARQEWEDFANVDLSPYSFA